MGNIGAPLRTSEDDELEDDEIHVSSSPLRFGLVSRRDEDEGGVASGCSEDAEGADDVAIGSDSRGSAVDEGISV